MVRGLDKEFTVTEYLLISPVAKALFIESSNFIESQGEIVFSRFIRPHHCRLGGCPKVSVPLISEALIKAADGLMPLLIKNSRISAQAPAVIGVAILVPLEYMFILRKGWIKISR